MSQKSFLLVVLLLTIISFSYFSQVNIQAFPSVPQSKILNDNAPDISSAIDPRVYGAKADGLTNDSAAIQRAIDYCAKNNGGIVILKNGNFLSSPLILKSGVYLKIDFPSQLKAISYSEYPNNSAPKNFITANGALNTGIFGTGIIEGNGSDWWKKYKDTKGTASEQKRPRLIYLINCKDVVIAGITLQNSPSFHFVPNNCQNVIVINVRIKAPKTSPNTDGIDPSQCNTVFIDKCNISTGDDNIAIKAGKGPTNNIYITNCTFGDGHGLSIGSETNHGVDGLYVKDCTFEGTTNGIRVKSPRCYGGTVQNLSYTNIKMNNVDIAIEFSGYYPESKIPAPGTELEPPAGSGSPVFINNVAIDGLTATNVKKAAGYIVGVPEKPIKIWF